VHRHFPGVLVDGDLRHLGGIGISRRRTDTSAFVFAAARYASIQYVPYGQSASVFDWPIKYVFLLAFLLVLLVVIRDWRASLRDKRLRLCVTFALAGFLGCFPRPDITHIDFSLPLALPLLAFCATELTRRLRPAIRYAIAVAILLGVCAPPAIAFATVARAALGAPTMVTPRGKVTLMFSEFRGLPELLPVIAAAPPSDGFFFYPQMPLVSFLTGREHVSKVEYFIPWYTTPAQYHEACLSTVRHASWIISDRRFADYSYWRRIYPAMPDTKPPETIQFEKIRDRAFEVVTIKGFFDLRRRREGISDAICDAIQVRE